jgi:transposase
MIEPDNNQLISNRYLKFIEAQDIFPELKTALGFLFSQWRFATLQLIEIPTQMRVQAAKQSKLEKIYRSVPGVGEVTARVLATELGDMSRFKNERALASYTGLTPCEYSSGGHVRKGSISRQGSARIRHLLVEVAWRGVAMHIGLRNAVKIGHFKNPQLFTCRLRRLSFFRPLLELYHEPLHLTKCNKGP